MTNGNPETPETRATCWAYFRQEMARIQSTSPARQVGLVLGMLLFGEAYVSRFARFTLPTLLAPENLKALQGVARLVTYTNEASYMAVWDVTKPLHMAGIDVEIIVMPETMTNEHLKYMTLGTAHSCAFWAAAHWRAGFHMMQPDHVFSEKFFPGLKKLAQQGHKAIGQATISAEISTAGPVLEQHRSPDGYLAIHPNTLGAIGWAHVHDQFKAFICNGFDTPDWVPPTTPMIWIGRDKLNLYSWHMNMDYLAPELVMAAPLPTQFNVFATIDTRWPYLSSVVPHQPALTDEMTVIELSHKEKIAQQSPVSAHSFAATAWHIMRFVDHYIPYFRKRSEFPIPVQNEWIEDDVIEAKQAAILQRAIAERPGIAVLTIQDQAFKRGWRAAA